MNYNIYANANLFTECIRPNKKCTCTVTVQIKCHWYLWKAKINNWMSVSPNSLSFFHFYYPDFSLNPLPSSSSVLFSLSLLSTTVSASVPKVGNFLSPTSLNFLVSDIATSNGRHDIYKGVRWRVSMGNQQSLSQELLRTVWGHCWSCRDHW